MTIFPLPSWIKNIRSIILDSTATILLFPIVIVLHINEKIDKKFGPKYAEWQKWFAWRPVQIGYDNGPIVWLETIERTRFGEALIYRKLGDTTTKSQWEYDDECG